jgi:hypothetical protein
MIFIILVKKKGKNTERNIESNTEKKNTGKEWYAYNS